VFTSVRHFLELWQHETSQTARVLGALTDESLTQPVAPGHRSLGEIAWHLATAQRELAGKAGLAYDAPTHATPRPPRAAEIHAAYRIAAAALGDALATEWTDDTLQERFEAYGMEWQKGPFLSIILRHEIHHRGQLTVLMRQAGLRVPGVYGPSKDDP
jgi:uncharacterized damage-inducible protein DinB